ncbi:hypothetical protein MHBO_001367 [Bonamia ostreae]
MDLNQKQKDLIFRALLQVSTQLISLGNYPHALVALEDSLKIDKDNINSLAMIVTVHNKIGNVEQENKYLRKLIKIVPFAAEFRLGLASNLFRKGSESSLEDREEAIKHLQKGIDAGNASSPEQLVFLLSDILLSLDREQEAIYYLSDFCESQRGAKIAKAQYKLAKTLLSRFPNDSKALEKVRFLLTKISETEKFSLQTQRNLASVLIKLGHYEEAENICRKMLILDSEDESVLELMSLIKRKRSDWKGVEAILLQLAKNKTLSPAQQFSLGVSRERQNKNVSVVFECYLNGLRELRRRCGRGTAKEEKWFKENPADLKILKDLSERCFSGGCSKEILNEIDSFQKWVKSA